MAPKYAYLQLVKVSFARKWHNSSVAVGQYVLQLEARTPIVIFQAAALNGSYTCNRL